MNNIKTCPCCNGESTLRSRCSWLAPDGYTYYVQCAECKTMSGYYETENEAIKAWNKRIPMDNLEFEYSIRGMHLPTIQRFCLADGVVIKNADEIENKIGIKIER